LIDVADTPYDANVVTTENWKVMKYEDLAFEIERMYRVAVVVLPVVVVGSLSVVTKTLLKRYYYFDSKINKLVLTPKYRN